MTLSSELMTLISSDIYHCELFASFQLIQLPTSLRFQSRQAIKNARTCVRVAGRGWPALVGATLGFRNVAGAAVIPQESQRFKLLQSCVAIRSRQYQ